MDILLTGHKIIEESLRIFLRIFNYLCDPKEYKKTKVILRGTDEPQRYSLMVYGTVLIPSVSFIKN